jgi:hypothetical protein
MTAAWHWLRGDRRELWSATWGDLKQLAWAFVCMLPMIAAFAYGARVLIGGVDAIKLAIGIAVLGFVAFAAIAVACIVGSLLHDLITRRLE